MDELRIETVAALIHSQRGGFRATARDAVRQAIADRGEEYWDPMEDQDIADAIYHEVTWWGLQW